MSDQGCRFHDRDLGPCIKAGDHPGSPHMCTRMKLVAPETLGITDVYFPKGQRCVVTNAHDGPCGALDCFLQPLYVISSFDGFIVTNTCEPWCSAQNAPPGSILTGRFACDCKGPLRRLPRDPRRDLRAAIFADNEYQRLGALVFHSAARSGLLDRWALRVYQLDERLDAAGVDFVEFVDMDPDHGINEEGEACSWSRWVIKRSPPLEIPRSTGEEGRS